jgi:hypothetical protein
MAVYVLAIRYQQHFALIAAQGVAFYIQLSATELIYLAIEYGAFLFSGCQVINVYTQALALPVYLCVPFAIFHSIEARHALQPKGAILINVIKRYLLVASLRHYWQLGGSQHGKQQYGFAHICICLGNKNTVLRAQYHYVALNVEGGK